MWERLEKIFREMRNSEDFILAMKLYLPTEDNKEEMMDAIEKGWVKNADDAGLYALAIYHDNPFEDEEDDG